MRLVIDLQCCQCGAAPDSLALAQQLARTAGEHEVWIALSNRFSDSIDGLRTAFSSLLPRERVVVFDLPARSHSTGEWRERASELIRENFLAGLSPDLVFVPRSFSSPEIVCAIGEIGASFSTVLTIDEAEMATPRVRQHLQTMPGNACCVLIAEDAGMDNVLNHAQCQQVDINNSGKLWETFVAIREKQHGKQRGLVGKRPKLAYISPLPPEKSGIADYSAELIPELARFYDIELVIDQAMVSDHRLSSADFPLRQLAWFEEHADEYDRILYHFGNSGVHQHMFKLIERHPGIVVLHDFFLSGVLDNLERDDYLPQGFLRAMYDSHGYTGLLDHLNIGRNPSIWKYPLNKNILDHASGVIVHSAFPKQLATNWYGAAIAKEWQIVPLLRGKANDDTTDDRTRRAQLRAQLGLDNADFVICSFGMLGRSKLNDMLLDAFLTSPLAGERHCKLVFVGANDPGPYGVDLMQKIDASTCASQIDITGFVSAESYANWLTVADATVQLREQTRGETSASVLDCLLYGKPTIINAHGSNVEIPDEVLIKLPDPFTRKQLVEELTRLYRDSALRARLSEQATLHMQQHHRPEHVGQCYVEAIEHLTQHSAQQQYRALRAAIGDIACPIQPGEDDLIAAARAIAANQPANAPRQLLVDVSAVVQSDIKTGIQRVVRSVLLALLASPPDGFRVEPVYCEDGSRGYRYARQFALRMIGETGLQMDDAPIETRAGDVFLGLDLYTIGTSQNQATLQQMRNRGMDVYFVLYDILPMLRPECFPPGTERHFGDYLHTIATVSDGLICISRAVADELAGWLTQQPTTRASPLKIGYFHLGADIDASAPTLGLPDNIAHLLDSIRTRPSFLMVGTVEPRKGHAQSLAAFELLWRENVDVNLVIVGKHGWMVDELTERMQKHPERDRRLFWLSGASDELLRKLYDTSTVLLSPSEGEGFGLPLIEAAQHNIPIIARNLPVFREVTGEHAYYFDGLQAQDLAEAAKSWLALHRADKAPQSTGLPWLTWRESAAQLVNVLESREWYKEQAPVSTALDSTG